MLEDPRQLVNIIAAGSAFAIVLAVWLAVLLLWSRRRTHRDREVHGRLGLTPKVEPGGRVLRLWHDGQEATTLVVKGRRLGTLWARLDRMREAAGYTTEVEVLLGMVLGAAGIAFLIVYALTQHLIAALGVGSGVIMVWQMYVQYRTNKRDALFERQFLDAMHVAVTSLRAGHPLAGAFRFASEQIPAPVGELFGNICQEQSLGVPFDVALRNAAARTTNPDVKIFASSVAIQIRSGGNLAEIIERLAEVIRERMRISRRLRVLTAQTRLSKWILVAMPFVLFVMINLLNPAYMDPMYATWLGRFLLGAAMACLLVGVWVMGWMVRARF
jgi:tight adherence protein B